MRRFVVVLFAFVAVAGCSTGNRYEAIPPAVQSSGKSAAALKQLTLSSGQSQSLTFNGTGSALAQSVTYSEPFEGDVTAKSADASVASVDPPTQRAQHDPGVGTKYVTFTITPVGPGTTHVTLNDKKGGSATIDVVVTAIKNVIVANDERNALYEIATSTGSGTPVATLQAGLVPNGIAFDRAGNLYVVSPAEIREYSGGSLVRTIAGDNAQLGGCATKAVIDDQGYLYVTACPGVVVFAPGANGNAVPARVLNTPGCGARGITLDGAGNMYLLQNCGEPTNHIDVYDVSATGSTAPLRTIHSWALFGNDTGLAQDASGNLYVSQGGYEILELANGSGDENPINTITGDDTQMCGGADVAIDASGDIWSANDCAGAGNQSLTEYARGSNGDALPVRKIQNEAIMGRPDDIAIAPSGNVYYADGEFSKVLAFAPTSNGSVSPTAEVSLGTPGMQFPQGFSIDPSGALYVAGLSAAISVYSNFTNGSPAPVRTVGFYPNYAQATDVITDKSGNMYATSTEGGGSIKVYDPSASGAAPPVRMISGSSTGLALPTALAWDPNGRIVVANERGQSITTYDAAASGNVPPLTSISGSNTMLNNPIAVAVDSAGYIYVANSYSDGGYGTPVVVFAPGSNGNAAPSSVIAGPSVQANLLNWIQVDNNGYIYGSDSNRILVWAPHASGDAAPLRVITRESVQGGDWKSFVVVP